MVRFASEASAIDWLATLYTSELTGFLLHTQAFLPLMIEKYDKRVETIYKTEAKKITQIYDTDSNEKNISILDRYIDKITLKAKYAFLNDEEFELYGDPPKNKRNRINTQWIIMVSRLLLNIIAIGLLFGEVLSSETSPYEPHEFAQTVTKSPYRYVSLYLFLASFGLYIISYFHQKYKLKHAYKYLTESTDPNLQVPLILYILAHFSLVNFSLDFPSGRVPTTKFTRFVVILANIIAFSIVIFTYYAIEPFDDAWGCYPSYYSYEQLDFGLCPAWYSSNPSFLTPCCDQPGVRCGTASEKANAQFDRAIFLAHMTLTISFFVYLSSITAKYNYLVFTWETYIEKNNRAIEELYSILKQ